MFNKILSHIKTIVSWMLVKFHLDKNRSIQHFFKASYHYLEYGHLYLRSQRPVVKLFGYSNVPSRDQVEIDITYRCNLACNNCNRSLGDSQAKSNESMSFEQVQKFLEDSVNNNFNWKQIRILGGEPTFHPQFFEILNLFLEYKAKHAPEVELQLWTNGCGEAVQKRLESVPDQVVVVNSSKVQEGDAPIFNAFNLAPIDSIAYKYTDFANGCSITEKCGVGVTPYGYYPCAIAGSIDRILGLDLGQKDPAKAYDSMRGQLNDLCRYCGHFRMSAAATEIEQSITWVKAYKVYKDRNTRPKLTKY